MELKDFMPNAGAAEEGYQARAGVRATTKVTLPPETVTEALQTIYDPEIPINLYDLGLIYDVAIDDCGNIAVTMTLTAPACPVAGQMPHDVADRLALLSESGEVTVTLTWEPPWNREMMSEDAKLVLDF